MQQFFEVTAPTVHRMVLELEARGFIRRESGKARSIQLLVAADALRASSSQSIKTTVQSH